MPYVSIMTAFELGDPVLLFVLVKTHDTPIHASPKPWPMYEPNVRSFDLCDGRLRDSLSLAHLSRRMVMDRSPAGGRAYPDEREPARLFGLGAAREDETAGHERGLLGKHADPYALHAQALPGLAVDEIGCREGGFDRRALAAFSPDAAQAASTRQQPATKTAKAR
jgi:hypothetical protein